MNLGFHSSISKNIFQDYLLEITFGPCSSKAVHHKYYIHNLQKDVITYFQNILMKKIKKGYLKKRT